MSSPKRLAQTCCSCGTRQRSPRPVGHVRRSCADKLDALAADGVKLSRNFCESFGSCAQLDPKVSKLHQAAFYWGVAFAVSLAAILRLFFPPTNLVHSACIIACKTFQRKQIFFAIHREAFAEGNTKTKKYSPSYLDSDDSQVAFWGFLSWDPELSPQPSSPCHWVLAHATRLTSAPSAPSLQAPTNTHCHSEPSQTGARRHLAGRKAARSDSRIFRGHLQNPTCYLLSLCCGRPHTVANCGTNLHNLVRREPPVATSALSDIPDLT